jgi:hypothetical protein
MKPCIWNKQDYMKNSFRIKWQRDTSIKVTLVTRPLRRSCADAIMVYSRHEQHVCSFSNITSHGSLLRLLVNNLAMRIEYGNTLAGNKISERRSVALWQVLIERQNSSNYGRTDFKQCISCNGEIWLQEFDIAVKNGDIYIYIYILRVSAYNLVTMWIYVYLWIQDRDKDFSTNDTPDFSSERATHDDKDCNYQGYDKNLVMSLAQGSTPGRTGWPTVSRNVTLTWILSLVLLFCAWCSCVVVWVAF